MTKKVNKKDRLPGINISQPQGCSAQHREDVSIILLTLPGDRRYHRHRGDHPIRCMNIKALCCPPETNIYRMVCGAAVS